MANFYSLVPKQNSLKQFSPKRKQIQWFNPSAYRMESAKHRKGSSKVGAAQFTLLSVSIGEFARGFPFLAHQSSGSTSM